MKITQVSVFIENTKGRLYNLCDLLGKNKIDIKALTLAESPDFGIARFIVANADEALDIVKKSGFTASIAHIVAVEVSDTPGGLAAILKILSENDIDIKYMYGFVEKASEKALMVFKFADIDKAIDVLQKNAVPIVSKEMIFKGNN
ncbi:MAG: amino acid-binding protein [Endomicrobia bacterium]|nr:amino acid-binding protein [Endomicrobiia bacterium]MCL2506315.1 amino acid-binding protein [Endomicrobiia bacterium]